MNELRKAQQRYRRRVQRDAVWQRYGQILLIALALLIGVMGATLNGQILTFDSAEFRINETDDGRLNWIEPYTSGTFILALKVNHSVATLVAREKHYWLVTVQETEPAGYLNASKLFGKRTGGDLVTTTHVTGPGIHDLAVEPYYAAVTIYRTDGITATAAWTIEVEVYLDSDGVIQIQEVIN